jgi:hypothetical protein
MISGENGPKGIPQGLKPIDFIGFIGTTEVVPFQNIDLFRIEHRLIQNRGSSSATFKTCIPKSRRGYNLPHGSWPIDEHLEG